MLILGEGKLHPTWNVNMGVKKGKRKEKNRHQPYARVPQPEQREETQRKQN